MNRLKTYDSTGIAPNGRLFSGDLNALQDAVAAITDLAQNLSVGSVTIGESGLTFSRFGAGEVQLAGALRTTGIMRALAGQVLGSYTTAARNAITLPPYGLRILNSDNNREEINLGTPGSPNWQPVGSVPLAPNTIGNRPNANTVQSGTPFFATDVDAIYVSNGSAWIRIGQQAGDIVWSMNVTAATGRVLAQGQTVLRTGIYADLFAKYGTTFGAGDGSTTFGLPDLRGRGLVSLGTHVDVNAIAKTDGGAVGSRRPAHKHTVVNPTISAPTHSLTLPNHAHSHTLTLPNHTHNYNDARGQAGGSTYIFGGGGGAFDNLTDVARTSNNPNSLPAIDGSVGNPTSNPAISGSINAPTASGGTVGPQTGSELTDSAGYFVAQAEIKL